MKAFIKVFNESKWKSEWQPTNLSIEESIRHYAQIQSLKIEWKNSDGSIESIII